MKLNSLFKTYYLVKEKKEPHERKIGRYNSSELYEIITDRLKPQDFLKPKTFDLTSYKAMYEGEIREYALKQLLDASEIEYEYQVKKVKQFNDFEIVCVADFVFPDYILECKSPREFNGIKEYNRPQLEIQARLFNMPVYVGYFKERFEYQVYKYIPSDKLFNQLIEKASIFHNQLKEMRKI